MKNNRADKNIVDVISRIKRFGDNLSIDEGLFIEERLENIRQYYSKEQFDKLVEDYKQYPENDAFEYSYKYVMSLDKPVCKLILKYFS